MISHQWLIDKFLFARKNYTFGKRIDYFDDCNIIGWTFSGDNNNPKSMVILMTNYDGNTKLMKTGKANAPYYDLTELKEKVYSDEHGEAEFRCKGVSVSVWIEEE